MAFRSLTENLDHDALGRVSVPGVRRARAVRTRLDPGTCRRRSGCRPQTRPDRRPAAGDHRRELEAIVAALDGGMSKAAVCRNFGVKRTTLIETLARVGWTGSRGASSR